MNSLTALLDNIYLGHLVKWLLILEFRRILDSVDESDWALIKWLAV